MDSILSNKKECYLCKNTLNLHRHHIFYGTSNRRKSEEQGCWVYLCARHHNMSDEGVHFDRDFDNGLKRVCQERWEELNGDRADFIKTFGRNYIL